MTHTLAEAIERNRRRNEYRKLWRRLVLAHYDACDRGRGPQLDRVIAKVHARGWKEAGR